MKKSKRKRVLERLLLLALVEIEIALLLAFVGMATGGTYIPFASEIYLFFRWIDGTGTDALLCFFGGIWALIGLPALIGYSIGEL